MNTTNSEVRNVARRLINRKAPHSLACYSRLMSKVYGRTINKNWVGRILARLSREGQLEAGLCGEMVVGKLTDKGYKNFARSFGA